MLFFFMITFWCFLIIIFWTFRCFLSFRLEKVRQNIKRTINNSNKTLDINRFTSTVELSLHSPAFHILHANVIWTMALISAISHVYGNNNYMFWMIGQIGCNFMSISIKFEISIMDQITFSAGLKIVVALLQNSNITYKRFYWTQQIYLIQINRNLLFISISTKSWNMTYMEHKWKYRIY